MSTYQPRFIKWSIRMRGCDGQVVDVEDGEVGAAGLEQPDEGVDTEGAMTCSLTPAAMSNAGPVR